MTRDRKHVVALRLGPVQECLALLFAPRRSCYGIRAIRKEPVAHVQTANHRRLAAFEPKPDRIALADRDHAGKVGRHALERPLHAAAAIGEPRLILPGPHLIRHEPHSPDARAIVEAPEADHAAVRLNVGDIERHILIGICIALLIPDRPLKETPSPHLLRHRRRGEGVPPLCLRGEGILPSPRRERIGSCDRALDHTRNTGSPGPDPDPDTGEHDPVIAIPEHHRPAGAASARPGGISFPGTGRDPY